MTSLLQWYEAETRDWAATEGLLWLQQPHIHRIMMLAAILYLPMTFGIQAIMQHTNLKLSLRKPLAAWNCLLVIFNLYVVYYLFMPMLELLLPPQPHELLCTLPESVQRGPASFALFAFALSKVPEMIDTLFLVLKRKPVIVLHWWHHLSVMIYCWDIVYSVRYKEGGEGLVFAVMNGIVHVIMYTYYGLAALGYRPPGDMAITTMQISQMVVGTVIAIYRLTNCHLTRPLNAFMALGMYLSYFILFGQFFYNRYIVKQRKQAEKEAANKSK